jgi:putative Mg2+ transporter-C (MgtC) family protein
VSVLEATSPSNVDVVVRLVVATGLGACIGLERELDGKDAGMRTHALLALGAALFGLLSVGAFGDFVAVRETTNVQVDVTRIASYVAAGVGFLAGGAIVKSADRVHGLTTATSMWSVSALGLAAGLGFWIAAVVASVITLLMLLAEKPLDALRLRKRQRSVSVVLRDGADTRAVLDLFAAAVDDEVQMSLVKGDGATTLRVRGLRPKDARSLLLQLQARDDVTETSIP